MTPRFDGYYMSGLQRSEDWHAGVKIVEEYYRYLKLYEVGRWLVKDHTRPHLDFPAYLSTVTEKDFEDGWAGVHPVDRNSGFHHQTGRFSYTADGIVLVFRCHLGKMHEVRRSFRLDSPERLSSESGYVYAFHPFTRTYRQLGFARNIGYVRNPSRLSQ